jgi:hypothetical protein
MAFAADAEAMEKVGECGLMLSRDELSHIVDQA